MIGCLEGRGVALPQPLLHPSIHPSIHPSSLPIDRLLALQAKVDEHSQAITRLKTICSLVAAGTAIFTSLCPSGPCTVLASPLQSHADCIALARPRQQRSLPRHSRCLRLLPSQSALHPRALPAVLAPIRRAGCHAGIFLPDLVLSPSCDSPGTYAPQIIAG
jgi:hypothetical protein